MSLLGSSHPAYDHLGARPTANLVRTRSRGSKTWHHVTCNLLGGERQKQVTPEKQFPLDKCNVVWHPLKRAPKAWKSNRTISGRAKSDKFQHLDRDKRRGSNLRGRDNERRQDFPILLHIEIRKNKSKNEPNFDTRRCFWKIQNNCKNQQLSLIWEGEWLELGNKKWKNESEPPWMCNFHLCTLRYPFGLCQRAVLETSKRGLGTRDRTTKRASADCRHPPATCNLVLEKRGASYTYVL